MVKQPAITRQTALKAEAKAAVGRAIVGRAIWIDVDVLRRYLPSDLADELSNAEIASVLRGAGWQRTNSGSYKPPAR